MRFACQSCGKAYNLPEERIAEKSNVKLKCRVCGAIVEVKKQGEIVAHVLNEGEGKRLGRVSEAPAPLTSMSPDDADDETAAIAFSDHILSEPASSGSGLGGPGLGGPGLGGSGLSGSAAISALMDSALGGATAAESLEGGLPLVPSAPATGLGGPLTPPPLAQPGAPPPRSEAASGPAFSSASLATAPPRLSPPPPPLRSSEGLEGVSHGSSINGSNGAPPRMVGDAVLRAEALRAPVANVAAPVAADVISMAPTPSPVAVDRDDTRRKMMAALATGMLIGFIVARLFF